MDDWRNPIHRRWPVLALALVVYLVAFPDDAGSLLRLVSEVLELSKALAPGVYHVGIAIIVAWAVARVWKLRSAPDGATQHAQTD